MRITYEIVVAISEVSRSQWPRGLRHELSSLARTLGSLVRILLKSIDICVCVYSVFMLPCDHLFNESYRLCKKDYEIEEETRTEQRAVEPLMNE
jgi:hypothetical protein